MQQLLSFVRKPTSIHIVVNTGGSVLNILFGALTHFLLFRIMSPVEYGVLTIWLSLAYALSTMLDFGTTATIYAYFPQLHKAREREMFHFLKSLISYQTGLAVLSAAVLTALFPAADTLFLKTGAPYTLMLATVAAIVGFILQNLTVNLLYAAKDFIRVNILINMSNVFKILVLLALIPLNRTDTTTIFTVITVAGSVFFFIPALLTRSGTLIHIWNATLTKKALRLRYTFTYLVSTQIFNLGQRMDLFLLSYFGLKAEAGYYAASQKILLSIVSAIISITQVLSPQFSHVKSKKEMTSLIKHALLYLSAPAVVFLLMMVTPQSLFALYLEKFARASGLARQLAPAYVIYSFANLPLLFLLYTVKKPGAILFANSIFFLGMALGCFLLIPQIGLAAIPAVVTSSLAAAAIILTGYSIYEYKKIKF